MLCGVDERVHVCVCVMCVGIIERIVCIRLCMWLCVCGFDVNDGQFVTNSIYRKKNQCVTSFETKYV